MHSAIILTNIKSNSVHSIENGKRISFKMKGDKKKQHGKLTRIGNTYIMVNGIRINLQDVSLIHYTPLSLAVMRALGLFFLLIGFLILLYGFLLMNEANKAEIFIRPMLTMIGAIFIAIGVAGDFLGVLPFMIHTRVYDLEKKWMAIGK